MVCIATTASHLTGLWCRMIHPGRPLTDEVIAVNVKVIGTGAVSLYACLVAGRVLEVVECDLHLSCVQFCRGVRVT